MVALDELPELATPSEVAAVLRCKSRWVLDQIKARKLRAVQIAGRYLVSPGAVREFIERCALECQEKTVAPISNGEKTDRSGKSSGSSAADSAALALAQEAVTKLISHSAATSSDKTGKQAARVIRLNVASRKS